MSVWVITRHWATDCDCFCDKMEIKAVCGTKEKAEEVLENMKQSHINWCMTRSWSPLTMDEAIQHWDREANDMFDYYSVWECETDVYLNNN